MFAWFGRGADNYWSRRTRWTPLLQSQREFQRTVTKERSRVDRNGRYFGFIILRLEGLNSARAKTISLAKILHQRLRDADEKGHLGYGRLGVMLPDTGPDDTEFVMHEILKAAAQRNLKIDGEAFAYPDQDSSPTQSGKTDELVHRYGDSRISPLAMMLPGYPRWKRGLDVMGAVSGLLISAPILAILAIVIKVGGRGPVFFQQRRTGYMGKPFTIYKLRSMVVDAEEMKTPLAYRNERDGPAFKMRKDPRITPLGRWLRATGLDELPQLVNVLRGEMSLVGPRPLPVDEAAQCEIWQQRRHDVKPGLTCFWQLSKSRNLLFSDWMRLDLRYSRRLSLRQDLALICRTVIAVFMGRVGH